MTVHTEPLHAATVHFADHAVVVTTQTARLNFRTYSVAEILGVQLDEQTLNQSVVVVILSFGILLAVIIASVSLVWAVGLLGISGLLTWAMRRAAPSMYTLRLTLPDGDHDALMARDRAYLVRIMDALHVARDAASPHAAAGPVPSATDDR